MRLLGLPLSLGPGPNRDPMLFCNCTPEQCFAQLDFPDVQAHETAEDYSGGYLVMRLTHDAEANTLSGKAVMADDEYHIDLAWQ